MFALLFHFEKLVSRLKSDESGASAAEYAILVAFIAVAIIGAVTAFGTALGGTFSRLGTALGGVG